MLCKDTVPARGHPGKLQQWEYWAAVGGEADLPVTACGSLYVFHRITE